MKTLSDLSSDPNNANRGTPRGRAMLEHSLRAYGAGRSVLVDKHGTLIAGNKTASVAEELGLSLREIETDGSELVVVKRTDLDLATDATAQMLALADNRVGAVSLDFDPAILSTMSANPALNLSAFWDADELKKALTGEKKQLAFLSQDEPPMDAPKEMPRPSAEQDRIPLSIVLNTYEARRWNDYKESIDEVSDKRALLALLETI